MTEIRWGMIGCGDVAEVKSGPGFQKATGSKLIAVMRRDGTKAADYAKRHNVPKWYDNADALIGDRDVDAVYVATPPGSHEELAMKVCAAGKPCYLEKPMSRNAAEARRMVEAFAKRKVPFFVAYYRRAQPRFLKIKELLDAGRLGRIQSVSYRMTTMDMVARPEKVAWRYQPEQSGGGLLLDVGSHALDMLDFLFGPLANPKGSARNVSKNFEVEDQVDLTFQIGKGVPGSAHWNFAADKKVDEFHIIGERGEVRFSCFTAEAIELKSDGREERIEIAQPAHVQQPLIQSIVDELLRKRDARTTFSTGLSALRTQEVMDAALADYYGGRGDGFWKS
jgi:1,5-anhydro-D-fructose reductase (1,5-anhydro-D-mannitol-forming)